MRVALFPLLFLLAAPHPVFSQSLVHLPVDVVKDEARIWTSPLRLHITDSKWLLPLAAGTAGLILTDHAVREDVGEHRGLLSPSRQVSKLGGALALSSASVGIYGIGKLTHHSHAAETGLLAGEAVVNSTLVVGGLKKALNRQRPFSNPGSDSFWEGGSSFPSGHAAASWSFAAVVARQYRDKPLVGIGAYGVATAVSLARVGGLNHFPSDVFVGAAVGELIGRFVVRRHGKN